MSTIIDALRRARQGRGPAPAVPSAPGIPAALRASGAPRAARRKPATRPRWGLLAGILIIAGAIYAGVRFGPGLLERGRSAGPVTTAQTEPAAPAANAGRGGMSSMTEMLDKLQEPPAIAPRAMDPITAPPAPAPPARRTVAPRAPAARPPLPAAPPRVLTAAPAIVAPPAPTVDHFAMAVRYHSLGNFEQALKHYLAVLETDEFNAEARNNLGLLYHERGLVPEAVDQFRRAILINPEYLRARSNLAVVLMKAGRLAEARAELRAAQAIDARSPDLIVNMALIEKADRKPQQAQELLMKAIGLQPTHAVAHYNLGLLYEEEGNRAKAADEYEEFLKYAGPEHGALLSDVRQKIDALMPRALPR